MQSVTPEAEDRNVRPAVVLWRERLCRESGLPATARLVALTLSTRLGGSGGGYPSIPTIAAEAGTSERTVMRHLLAIEAAGWLIVTRRRGGRNRYEIRVPQTPPDPETGDTGVTGDSVSPVTLCPKPVTPVSPGSDTGVTRNRYREEQEGSRSPRTTVDDATFDAFWAKYPKRKSKADAKRALAKALKATTLDAILDGLDRAKRHDHRFREQRFTPYPATWLNDAGWEDEHDGTESDAPFVGVSWT